MNASVVEQVRGGTETFSTKFAFIVTLSCVHTSVNNEGIFSGK